MSLSGMSLGNEKLSEAFDLNLLPWPSLWYNCKAKITESSWVKEKASNEMEELCLEPQQPLPTS